MRSISEMPSDGMAGDAARAVTLLYKGVDIWQKIFSYR